MRELNGTLADLRMVGTLADGKLACCCAPVVCCLYPWPDEDFTLYPHSDLPDTLYSFGTPETGFHKVSPYNIPTLFGYDVTICYQADGDPLTCIGFTTPASEDGQWVYLTDYTTYGDIYETIGNCLITLPDSGTTRDDFDGELNVSDFNGATGITLVRESLCVWSFSTYDFTAPCTDSQEGWFVRIEYVGTGFTMVHIRYLCFDPEFGSNPAWHIVSGASLSKSLAGDNEATPLGNYSDGTDTITVT